MEKTEILEQEEINIEKRQSLLSTLKKYAIEMLIYIIISVVIILIIRTFVVQHVRVSGSSMEPALKDKQHLLIEKISYKFEDIKRYDVIVFRPYAKEKDLFAQKLDEAKRENDTQTFKNIQSLMNCKKIMN